ncbi:hypothetical protein HY230_05560 [Candidatus Acetothermia bacterium]|nr:hypothetical protein [Candidatus Acetothermia bacterium]
METIRTTAKPDEARSIQQFLISSGIVCYIRSAGEMLEVQVSPNDLGKAEEILKKQSPTEAMPSEISANSSEISMNEREKAAVSSPAQSPEDVEPSESQELKALRPYRCLRCRGELAYVGEETFTTEGLLFRGRRNLDIYACSSCGHVEFFLPSGGQMASPRPRPSMSQASLRVAKSEYEARVIQQLLNGAGIDCNIIALESGFFDLQVPESEIETAKGLLEAQPSDGKLQCTHCQSPLDFISERILQTDDAADYSVKMNVYLCPQCYQVLLLDRDKPRVIVDIQLSPEERYDILSQRATQLIDRKELKEAIRMYQQMIDEFPEWAEEPQRCIKVLNERIAQGI